MAVASAIAWAARTSSSSRRPGLVWNRAGQYLKEFTVLRCTDLFEAISGLHLGPEVWGGRRVAPSARYDRAAKGGRNG